MKPLHLTNLYFLTSAGNKMHSLVRKSSLVRRKDFMKPASGSRQVTTETRTCCLLLIFSAWTYHSVCVQTCSRTHLSMLCLTLDMTSPQLDKTRDSYYQYRRRIHADLFWLRRSHYLIALGELTSLRRSIAIVGYTSPRHDANQHSTSEGDSFVWT